MNRLNLIVLLCVTTYGFAGCNKEQPAAPPPVTDTHSHDDGHDHDHDHDHGTAPTGGTVQVEGSHGPSIQLGDAPVGDWFVRAARSEGQLTAGGDAAVDVWLTGGTSKVTAVRFWIGVESAAGSVKARAEVESPSEPNHLHAHVEVPSPLPADAKLWVELDIEGTGKKTGSFALGG